MEGELDQYHQTLDMLARIDAPVKLVIAGNHDLSLDRDFVFGHLKRERLTEEQADARVKQARDLWTGPDGRARVEGITFLDEGTHHIDLPNGARMRVYASPYTPEFYDWGFPYERDEDRFNTPGTSLSDAKNIAPCPVPSHQGSAEDIDILITHGPPYDRLDTTSRGDKAGCPYLLRAVMRSRPLLHCFGHIHEGWGAEVVSWSPNADAVTGTPHAISEWRNGAWQAGVEGVQKVDVNLGAAKQQHAVFLDISSQSGKGVKTGEQTALINAAIMDVQYKPVNSPWIVDLDLPKA